MVNILNQTNSIANHFLYEMRHSEIQKDRAKFRNNLNRLGMIAAYEISMSLDYQEEKVQTPLAEMNVNLLTEQPVIISILRAAVPFAEGFTQIFDNADMGFIGAYRKEEGNEISVNFEYLACPSVEGRTVIMVDPMLATGKSIVECVEHLSSYGTPKHLCIASVVAAPEGIDYLSKMLKISYSVWTCALDEKLNENAYIVPGLGDAGDLCFGPKL